MSSKREPSISIDTAITAFLNAKQKGNDTGNYRLQAEHVLSSWSEWLRDRGVTNLSSIDTQIMRRYQYLRSCVGHC